MEVMVISLKEYLRFVWLSSERQEVVNENG